MPQLLDPQQLVGAMPQRVNVLDAVARVATATHNYLTSAAASGQTGLLSAKLDCAPQPGAEPATILGGYMQDLQRMRGALSQNGKQAVPEPDISAFVIKVLQFVVSVFRCGNEHDPQAVATAMLANEETAEYGKILQDSLDLLLQMDTPVPCSSRHPDLSPEPVVTD